MDIVKNFFKKVKWESLISALFIIAIGVLFIVLPESSAQVLCYVTGGLFVTLGVIFLVRYLSSDFIFSAHALILGLVLLFVGLLTIIRPELVQGIITIIFGIYLIADGAIQIQNAIECFRAKAKGTWAFVLSATLSIALGVLIMLNTFTSVMIFCGISLVVDGVCDFIVTLIFSSKIKKVHKAVKEIIEIEQD